MRLLASALLMLAVVPLAQARVWTVSANPDMTFTPAYLVIDQYDSVLFINAGGLHNVRADDSRFICALNCTTHNAPSTQAWHVTVQFRHLGSFGYYCEAHGDLLGGMRGQIMVIDRVFVDGFDAADGPLMIGVWP